MTASKGQLLFLIGLLVATAFLVRWHHYAPELGGAHAFRQTQTASISELIYNGQGTFFKPISYLGLPGDVMAVEPPVYQWLAAKICEVSGGFADWKLRLLSTSLGIFTALLLGGFIRNITGDPMLGWLGAAFYCGAVLPAFFHTTPMPDNLILCLESFALYALSTKGSSKTLYIIGGILASTIAVGLKPPLACGLFAVLPMLLRANFKWPTAILLWALMGFFGGILALAWSKWGQYITADGYFCFLFTTGFNQAWNLGWFRLLQSDFWTLMPLRLLQQSCFLSLPPAIIAILSKSPHRNFLLLWLCGELLGTLVFPNLNYIHNYYQLRFAPCIAAAGALGWQMAFSLVIPKRPNRFLTQITIFAGISCLFLPLPILYFRHTQDDEQLKRVKLAAAEIQTMAKEECVGLIQHFSFGANRQFSWDPSFAYFTKRQVYPFMEFNVGSYYYNNFDEAAKVGFSTILVIGSLTCDSPGANNSATGSVAFVEKFLTDHYYVERSTPVVRIYKRKQLPANLRARD